MPPIVEMPEGYESIENKLRLIVDVRDLAAALLMVYEKPEAEGRYICTSHQIRVRELLDKLQSIYPNYNYPKKYISYLLFLFITSSNFS